MTMVSSKDEPPLMVILGGPNGAGKSSSATALLPAEMTFLNADDVARDLVDVTSGQRDVEAARVVLTRMEELERQRASFAIETTLASLTLAARAARMKPSGYRIRIVYIWSASPEFSTERVAARVRSGGHDILVETIR